ncbi:MAG TPA: S41 family peptidase [Gemmatimonadales bacterium]
MPLRTSLWLLGCAAVALPAAPSAAAQQLSAAERARLAATVWSNARYNYAYWDRVHADWDSAFDASLALASQRQSDVSWFRQLRRLVALLEDGQAEIVPPAPVRARFARPPMMVRAVEGRPFIMDYAENAEMRIARPERLAEIMAVQEIPAETWIRDSILPETPGSTPAARWQRAVAWMLAGDRGTALHLRLRLPGGEERGASVTRSAALGDRWPLALPALSVDTLPDGVFVAHLNAFESDAAAAFDAAFRSFAGVRGLILDLRENTGAASEREIGYRILARLAGHPFLTSRWRTPQYRPAYRGADMPDSAGAWFSAPPDTILPRGDLPSYPGPLAVLASGRTAGAAEDFLVAYRNAARGPIIGETSAGSTGQVQTLPLLPAWSLRLTVTRDAFPDGTEFARTGIAPELPVAETVKDLQAGTDAALERARAYLAERAQRSN